MIPNLFFTERLGICVVKLSWVQRSVGWMGWGDCMVAVLTVNLNPSPKMREGHFLVAYEQFNVGRAIRISYRHNVSAYRCYVVSTILPTSGKLDKALILYPYLKEM